MRTRFALISLLIAGLRRRRRNLIADERGVVAVEFAMVAVPFIGITFAIVEMSLLLFAGQALDTALQDTSRRVMTGQVQVANMTSAQFKTDLCSRMPSLIDCTHGLYVDVRSYPDAAPAPSLPINSGNFDPTGFIFKPGGPSCIVVARAAIKYKVYTSLLGDGMSALTGGDRVLMSTVSFRNEPYNMPTPPPCQAT